MEQNKPVIIGSVSAATLIAIFQAVMKLGRSSGWWDLSEEEFSDWLGLGQIAIPVIIIAVTAWWTSRRTTSLSQPTDEDGTRLVRETDRQPAKQEMRSIEKALTRKE